MIRAAQLLLIVAAAALWAASRLDWVSLRTFDGLGQPKTTAIDGATWSTALVPLAVLLLAAALAGLAVRGWLLRAVGLLVAASCLAAGYLGVSLLTLPDVAPRAAALTGMPVMHLVGSQRHVLGASITLAASVCALIAAVLLTRAASTAKAATKYDDQGAAHPGVGAATAVSERVMWDAMDAGHDPTAAEGRGPEPAAAEGRGPDSAGTEGR